MPLWTGADMPWYVSVLAGVTVVDAADTDTSTSGPATQ